MSRAAAGRSSRRKGNAFQGRVRADIRETLGEGWTVSSPPARFQRGQDGLKHGDITVVGPRPFAWCIECKAESTTKLHHLLTGKDAGWRRQWAQAVEQADAAGRWPMLVTRELGVDVWVVVRFGDTWALGREGLPPGVKAGLGRCGVFVCRWSDPGARRALLTMEAD